MALNLLQEDRAWPDPLDADNAFRMSQMKWKQLRRWYRKTLGMWENSRVQIPTHKIGCVIGSGGEMICSLVNETRGHIHNTDNKRPFKDVQL